MVSHDASAYKLDFFYVSGIDVKLQFRLKLLRLCVLALIQYKYYRIKCQIRDYDYPL